MKLDIIDAVKCGASGVVFGVLTQDAHLDIPRTMELARCARTLNPATLVTIHRAIDLCQHPVQELSNLLAELSRSHVASTSAPNVVSKVVSAFGTTPTSAVVTSEAKKEVAVADANVERWWHVDRVLSSGGCRSTGEREAREVLSKMNTLVRTFGHDRSATIRVIAGGGVTPQNVRSLLQATGVDEMHASCRRSQNSALTFLKEDVSLGNSGVSSYSRMVVDGDTVQSLLKELEGFDGK